LIDGLVDCSTAFGGEYGFEVLLGAQNKETKAVDWIVSSLCG